MTPEIIIIPPGSRVRLTMIKGRIGPEVALHDVENPMHVINDDGSEGAMNLKPQFLFFQWFFNEAMMRDFWKGVVAEAVEEEREACAKIADVEACEGSTYQWSHAAEQIAETIRARSALIT